MEFYFSSTSFRRLSISVSIPNGMEFYAIIKPHITRSRVSIPNGMEFYNIVSSTPLASSTFQFPTGWNSTISPAYSPMLFRVPIPNGMEFYLMIPFVTFSSPRFQFPTGWNSTGMDKNFRRLARDVSIPKGIDYPLNLY